jgi:hypothetical protein
MKPISFGMSAAARCVLTAVVLVDLALSGPVRAQSGNAGANASETGWLRQPLAVVDCLNLALTQNADILKAKSDLEAAHGVVVQTRAVALPHLKATGQFKETDGRAVEGFANFSLPKQDWNSGLQLVQTVYDGGRMTAAIRAGRATAKQAVAQYQTVIADTLLRVRLAYYDDLLAAQEIVVNEASVNLLQKELDDQKHRYEAGTVPRFNVLRAEVAVANQRPALIRAHNNDRLAKNNLANLLGYHLPAEVWEDLPLRLTDTLAATPYSVKLPDALQRALANRSELAALRKTAELQQLNIINARSGYKPTLQAFAGYGWFNAQFTQPVTLDHDIHGWNFGGQLSWDLFDGMLTRGKVIEAKAHYERANIDVDDTGRRIELEVRTAYSTFSEARELLDSQLKVQEQAEESLRLARARAEAGTGTQLDVLDAQTSLTQARTTQVQALHDYATARARLERAMGEDVTASGAK